MAIDLLLGTDFADAFVDVYAIPGQPGEPVAKMNCFGWYVLGHLATSNSRIQVDVGTTSVIEDLNILYSKILSELNQPNCVRAATVNYGRTNLLSHFPSQQR